MLTSPLAIASKVINTTASKQELVRYHDTGQYMKEINSVMNDAISYLNMRLQHRDPGGRIPTLVLDIDETSLSNYAILKKLNFQGTPHDKIKAQNEANDPAITPTLRLYRFAKANHVAVFFITGRYESQRHATVKNLEKAGYHHWNGLFLRNKAYAHAPAAIYKTAVRKQLSELGYNIILNIGDQYSDLRGGYAEKTFKLPDPYYFIP